MDTTMPISAVITGTASISSAAMPSLRSLMQISTAAPHRIRYSTAEPGSLDANR